MAAMVVEMLGKVEHDQRVAENFGRGGENRTCRPSLTELDSGGRLVVGRVVKENCLVQV